jgi:penicillin-binding protein 1C
VLLVLLMLAVSAVVLDRLFPLPDPGRSAAATLVVARDGTPLRAFPQGDHIWRYPVTLDQVSPRYLEALLAYEDRAFWWHPGINPASLARAAWQRLRYGRVVSGGSTLTMQVARILDPTPHTLRGKVHQIARALQFEAHLSKREILMLYLNYAPMGGVVEGVEAASRAYLGKPASRLSPAEAALLTVLPQAPSLLRPDRFARRARVARDKVIERMRGKWDAQTIRDALSDPVSVLPVREPVLAPQLAQRVRRAYPHVARIDTLVDPVLQAGLEDLLAQRASSLPKAVSSAALVIDNDTLAVLAYAGTADYGNPARAGYLDMVPALRSPGSTLKPFLYALALDDGLIDSESLLIDAPQSFHGYSPGNFEDSFHGAVSVSEALTDSLNVPAVDLLDRLGPTPLVARLRAGGLRLVLPRDAEPNLSVILGGAASSLEQLVGAYRALAQGGLAGVPRLTPDEPRREFRMMSAGAAFIVRDILLTGGTALAARGEIPGVAWKTGTSYGYRDAWSVGVSDRYTVGVWVGRPDGTASPGLVGANVAQPLLMQIFAGLPHGTDRHTPPPDVTRATVCWPLGARAADTPAPFCLARREAWLLNGTAPPTLPERNGDVLLQTLYVDAASGLRVTPACTDRPYVIDRVARWPVLLAPWLDADQRAAQRVPDWERGCGDNASAVLQIDGVRDGDILRRKPQGGPPVLQLSVRGAQANVHWLVDGRQFGLTAANGTQTLTLALPGAIDITAVDEGGRFAHARVTVAN